MDYGTFDDLDARGRERLEIGEAERRFGAHFTVERLDGHVDWSQWPPGWAAYWLRRRP